MQDGDVFDFVGKSIHDKYRIDEVVGEGGFGVVYRGYHLSFEQPIAVKCLKVPTHFTPQAREVFLDRFRQEGKHLAALGQHGSVTRVYDFAVAKGPVDDAVPYLVLEWLDGRDLDAVLAERKAKGRPFPEREALELLRPAIDALAFAHELNIAHRDIKPANLFFANTPRGPLIKILDFGIAKVMQDGDDATRGTTRSNSGFRAFSPMYGAPEQFVEETFGATGPWTDVHALGLILTEMVSGRPAMSFDNAADLFEAATRTERPTPRSLGTDAGDGFEQIVSKALALHPRDRFRDAQELLAAIDAWLVSGERSIIRPPGTPRGKDRRLSSAETKLAEGPTIVGATWPSDYDASPHVPAPPSPGPQSPPPHTPPPHSPAPPSPSPHSPSPHSPSPHSPSHGPFTPSPHAHAASAPPVGLHAAPPHPPAGTPAPASRASTMAKILTVAFGLFAIAVGAVLLVVLGPDDETESAEEAPEEEPEELPEGCVEGAVAPCEAACARGDHAGCVQLGWMLVEGNVAPRDYDRARELFVAACHAGDSLGCNNLGWLHFQGLGVPANHGVAVGYFRRACEQDDPFGCNNLAAAYRDGVGVGQDLRQAMGLFERACGGGNPQSCHHLGLILTSDRRVTLDPRRAAELFAQACEGGVADSCSQLGNLYEQGQGVGTDFGLAVDRYADGCRGGSALGCNYLGWAFERGLGELPRSLPEAKSHYRRACDAGSDLGCRNLKRLGG